MKTVIVLRHLPFSHSARWSAGFRFLRGRRSHRGANPFAGERHAGEPQQPIENYQAI